MGAFRILAFLTVSGCSTETGVKIGFRYHFDVRPRAQGPYSEAIAIERLKFLAISMEPRLHCLNHQLYLILGGSGWTFPLIAGPVPDVLPRVRGIDCGLGVHQQNRSARHALIVLRGSEALKCLLAPTAGDNSRHATA